VATLSSNDSWPVGCTAKWPVARPGLQKFRHTKRFPCTRQFTGVSIIFIPLPNIFTHSEAVWNVDWICIMGRLSGGEWANMWHWTKSFTIFFPNRK